MALIEAIRSLHFTITIETAGRTVQKSGRSFRDMADAIDGLYEDDLCPFNIDMDEDDPDWWDYDDEFEEILGPDEIPDQFRPPDHEE